MMVEFQFEVGVLFYIELMLFNVGLQYLFIYGVLWLVVDMDGEYVICVELYMGYFYIGFEKMMEYCIYQ